MLSPCATTNPHNLHSLITFPHGAVSVYFVLNVHVYITKALLKMMVSGGGATLRIPNVQIIVQTSTGTKWGRCCIRCGLYMHWKNKEVVTNTEKSRFFNTGVKFLCCVAILWEFNATIWFSFYIPQFPLFLNCLYCCIQAFQGSGLLIAVCFGFTGHVMAYCVSSWRVEQRAVKLWFPESWEASVQSPWNLWMVLWSTVGNQQMIMLILPPAMFFLGRVRISL